MASGLRDNTLCTMTRSVVTVRGVVYSIEGSRNPHEAMDPS